VLFALAELLGSTLAWYTAADSITNSMVSLPKKFFFIDVVDVFNPIPNGGIYYKNVGAVNPGEKPGFVRLLVSPVFVVPPATPGDPPILLPGTIGKPLSDALVMMKDFNGGDWIDATDLSDGGDGYFYYKYVLEPGNSIDLFHELELANPLPPGYENATLVIEVKCEAMTIKPPTGYITSWWGGAIPAPDTILYDVHDALQQSLA